MTEPAVFAVVNDANGDIDFLRNLFSKLPQAVSKETDKKLDLIALIGNTPGSQMSTEELKEFDEGAWALLCDEFNANREGWQKKRVMNAADLGSVYAVDPCGNPASVPFRRYIGAVDAGGIPVEGILVSRFRKFYRDLGEAIRPARSEGIKVKVMGTNIFHTEALPSDSYLDWQRMEIKRLVITSSGLDELTDAADAPLLAYRSGKSIDEDEALKSTFLSDMKESGVIICNSNIPSKERLIKDERYMIIAGQKNPIAHGKIMVRESNYLPSKVFDEIAHKLPHSPVSVYVFDGRAGAHFQFVWHTETGAFQKASKHNFRLHEDPDAEQTRDFSGERMPIRPPDANTPPPVPGTEPAHFSQPEEGQGTRPLALEARIHELEGQLAAANQIETQLETDKEELESDNKKLKDHVKAADEMILTGADIFKLVERVCPYVRERYPELVEALSTEEQTPTGIVYAYFKQADQASLSLEQLQAQAQEGLKLKTAAREQEAEIKRLTAAKGESDAAKADIESKYSTFVGAQGLFSDAVRPLADRLKALVGGKIQDEDPQDILEQIAGLVQSGELDIESGKKLKAQYEQFEQKRAGYEQSAREMQDGHKKEREGDKKKYDAEIERLTDEQVTQLNSRNDDVDSAREERDQEKEKALNLERTAERKQKEYAALEHRLGTATTELEELRKGQPDAGELSTLRQARDADKKDYDAKIAAKQKEIDGYKTELDDRKKKLEHADQMFGAVMKVVDPVASYLKTRFGGKLAETEPLKVIVEFTTKKLKAGDEPGAGDIEKRIAAIEGQRAALEQENNKLKDNYATAQTRMGQVQSAAELQLTEVRKDYDGRLDVKAREYAALEQRRQTSEQKYGKAVEDRTDLEERLKKAREDHSKELGKQRTDFEKQLGDARKQYEADLKRVREEKGEPDAEFAARVKELEESLKTVEGERDKAVKGRGVIETDYKNQIGRIRAEGRSNLENAQRDVKDATDRAEALDAQLSELRRCEPVDVSELVSIVNRWVSGRAQTEIRTPPAKRYEAVVRGMLRSIERSGLSEEDKEVVGEACQIMLQNGAYNKRIAGLREHIVFNSQTYRKSATGRHLKNLAMLTCAYLSSAGFANRSKQNREEYGFLLGIVDNLSSYVLLSETFDRNIAESDEAHKEELAERDATIGELESSINTLSRDYAKAMRLCKKAYGLFYSSPDESRQLYECAYKIVSFKEAKKNIATNIASILYTNARDSSIRRGRKSGYKSALQWLKRAWQDESRDYIEACNKVLGKAS